MRLVAQLALGVWLGLGLTCFCAWAIHTVLTKELAPGAGPTESVVFFVGRACIWGGAAVLATAVAGGAAMVIWKAAVGP